MSNRLLRVRLNVLLTTIQDQRDSSMLNVISSVQYYDKQIALIRKILQFIEFEEFEDKQETNPQDVLLRIIKLLYINQSAIHRVSPENEYVTGQVDILNIILCEFNHFFDKEKN